MVSQYFVFLTRCSVQQANNTMKLSLASFPDRCRASVCDVCHHLVGLLGITFCGVPSRGCLCTQDIHSFVVVNGGGRLEGLLSCVTFILYDCSICKTVRLLRKVICWNCCLAQALAVLRVSSRLAHRAWAALLACFPAARLLPDT